MTSPDARVDELAGAAVRRAAEQLGIGALPLAEWLVTDHHLAVTLQILSEPRATAERRHDLLGLLAAYVSFLEEQVRCRRV